MNKSVIDKMNKKEILELLSPYLNKGQSGKEYYEMLTSFSPKIKLQDDVRYPNGRIDISINMVDLTGINKWDDIGSVGLNIYPEIVANYRDHQIKTLLENE